VIARIAATLTASLGIAAGLILLFAPLGTRCSATISAPAGTGQTSAPAVMHCENTSMVQEQGLTHLWPMPLVALIVWSLAPLLAVAGVRSGRMSLVTAALLIEATVLISFGAAPIYAPLVLLPLAITCLIAWRTRRSVSAV
jgi:hypothetical protein